MGLKQDAQDLWSRQLFTVKSTPAHYEDLGPAAQDILTISGGPVHIQGIIEVADTVIAATTDSQVHVGVVAMDTAAVAITAATAGMMCVSPLDAAVAKVAFALNVPMPSLLGFVTNLGVIASPGVTINVVFDTADMGAAELYSLIVLYRKMTPAALIS